MENILYIAGTFFLIAAVYSTAGFGGGSSYLAILALSEMDYMAIRVSALLCNSIVAGTSSITDLKITHLKKDLFPYLYLSVPMAALGGMTPLNSKSFFILLGIVLFISVICMMFRKTEKQIFLSWPQKIISGGLIGYISGLAGIGGGVLLAPFLHLTAYRDSKKIATCTSFFIFINSLAALLSILIAGNANFSLHITLPLVLAVFIGGLTGSHLRNRKLSRTALKTLSAFLILFVSLKILKEHLLEI